MSKIFYEEKKILIFSDLVHGINPIRNNFLFNIYWGKLH